MLCNLCGADEPEELQVQEGFRILSEGREIPFDVRTVLCPRCGLVYTDPQPDAAQLARFYAAQERDAFVETGAGPPVRIPGEGSRLDQARWIEARVGPLAGLRVLEVGCYEGYLLELLARRGARCVGVEPSEAAARLARERFGLDVRTAAFEGAALGEEPFDLVVLSHVLEHLRDPHAVIARCRALLREGGALFVEVPNVLRPRVESAVDFFTFDHLFNFCPETLGALARRCGFRPAGVEEEFPFPAFRLLARAEGAGAPVRPDARVAALCREVVSDYGARRRRFLATLRARIDARLPAWLAAGSRVALYGAGYHTECLLQHTALARARLVALVDGNPAKQGGRLFGLPVVAPEALRTLRPDVVVISSYDFQDEMVETLDALELGKIERVCFYDEVHAFATAPAGPSGPAPAALRSP